MDMVTHSRARDPDSVNPVEESYRLELAMVMRTKASGGTCMVKCGERGKNKSYLKA
jgi:hypothetical protein